MKFSKTIGLVLVVVMSASCDLVAQRSRRKNESKPHHENLTDLRLSFPDIRDTVIQKDEPKTFEFLPASNAVHAKVDEVLDSIARFNKTKMFFDGFTIQIYSGLKQKDAMEVIKQMKDEVRDITPDIIYQQPKFRVKVGSYFSRLEAQRDLHRLKRIFPNAILIPEKVAMK